MPVRTNQMSHFEKLQYFFGRLKEASTIDGYRTSTLAKLSLEQCDLIDQTLSKSPPDSAEAVLEIYQRESKKGGAFFTIGLEGLIFLKINKQLQDCHNQAAIETCLKNFGVNAPPLAASPERTNGAAPAQDLILTELQKIRIFCDLLQAREEKNGERLLWISATSLGQYIIKEEMAPEFQELGSIAARVNLLAEAAAEAEKIKKADRVSGHDMPASVLKIQAELIHDLEINLVSLKTKEQIAHYLDAQLRDVFSDAVDPTAPGHLQDPDTGKRFESYPLDEMEDHKLVFFDRDDQRKSRKRPSVSQNPDDVTPTKD